MHLARFKCKYRWCAVIALLALSQAVTAAPLLSNAGFESGSLAPWWATYSGPEFTEYSVSSAAAHSGSYGAAGVCGPGIGGAQGPVALRQSSVVLQPDSYYRLTLWYRTSGAGWGSGNVCDAGFVEVSAGGTETVTRLDVYSGSSEWKKCVYVLKTRADTASGGVNLNTYQINQGDTIYFDDFELVQTEPTVNNTGFENSTWAPWTVDNGRVMIVSQSSVNPHSGLKCAVATGGSTAPREGSLRWKDVAVRPDTDYRVQVWVRSAGTTWGTYGGSYSQSWFKAVVEEADSGGIFGSLGTHDLFKVESVVPNWTRLVADFTTGPTTTQARVTFRGHLATTGDSIAFDDMAFTIARMTKASWVPWDISGMRNAIADGADAVGFPIQDLTYSYYPSAVSVPSPTLGDGKAVSEAVQYAHDMGVLIEGAIPPCVDQSILTVHPEWRRRYTDSTYWLTAPVDQVSGCLVSPYGDYLIEEVKEAASVVGVDGITFDGYNYLTCYCDYCKAKFLADTGYSIPASVNYDSAVYRAYILWQDAQIMAHIARMKAAVKAIYPKFDFCIWSTNAGRYGHYLTSPRVMPTELNAQFDCAMQEWWADDSNIGLSVIPEFGSRYLGALASGQMWFSDLYLFTHFPNDVVYASSMPDEEVKFRFLSAIASGSIANIAGTTEKTYLNGELFALANARIPWTNKAVSLPWAALLVSEPTRQFYGRSDAVNLYMNNCFGFFLALMEQHLPVDIITQTDLRAGAASKYKVLILPNAACLSTADTTAIRAFVAAGGGLVATGATSLYDDQGVIKSNYALSDLFRANRSAAKTTMQSKVTITDTLFNRNSVELGRLLTPTGRTTTFSGEVFPSSVASGGTTLAAICRNSSCSLVYPAYIANSNTGGGRVAFLPVCLDSGYFKNPHPYEAVLMKDAVMWAANSTPPVTIVGPKSLQVTYYTQNGGKRVVVHLLNAGNSGAGRAYSGTDVPVRDEVVPIRNVEVWFESSTPASVKLQPENQSLSMSAQGGRTRVIVPELQVHSMVVADIP